jgi:two-component system, cell cycle sensor histidine kinase and response regulator CckA
MPPPARTERPLPGNLRTLQDCERPHSPHLAVVQGASDISNLAEHAETFEPRVVRELARLRAERELADARYKLLFDRANDAIAVLTLEGVVLDVNRRWAEITQRPREELIGLHVRDFSPSGHAEANAQRFRAMVEAGGTVDGPVPIAQGDGATLFFEFSSTRIDLGKGERIFAIGRDVTDVVVAERRLAERERELRSLVDNVPDVLWSATSNGKFTFVSPNASKVIGLTAGELLSSSLESMSMSIHPADKERCDGAWDALLNRGTPLDIEFRWQRSDGRWIWLHARASRSYDADGNPRIDGAFIDVTEHRRVEDMLFEAQKIETIGQLSAGIAHDFNNLLAVVLCNAQYIVEMSDEDRDTSDDIRTAAEDIRAAAERGKDLNVRLGEFARRGTTEPEPVDLAALIRGMDRMLACALGRSVKLTVHASSDLEPVLASASQVERVLMNLAVNARDAMPQGGSLTIEAANVQVTESEQEALGLAPGPYGVLSARDTGMGMSEAIQRRIFEPFFTTKEPGRGTGLGLATCYGVARRYGGVITVESSPGKGSTFRLYLPCAAREVQSPSPGE